MVAGGDLKTTPPTRVTGLDQKKRRSLKIAQNFRKNTYIPSTNWIFMIFDETFFSRCFGRFSNLLPTWFQGLKILCRKSLNVTVSTPGVMFWWLPPRASVIRMIINVFETRCGAPPSSDWFSVSSNFFPTSPKLEPRNIRIARMSPFRIPRVLAEDCFHAAATVWWW